MERNVIYFPYIRVPKDQWFTQVLLYWDQIGSIVPMDYIREPTALGKYMQNLVTEGLVKQIIPVEFIYDIPNFTGAFLEYVDSPEYPVSKNVIEKNNLETFNVHMEKLGSIGDELAKRGLARSKDWPWYNIEAFTANQFMAYLAASLGKLPRINSVPITDSSQNLFSFSPQQQEGRLNSEIDEMRTIVLKNILPSPESSIEPSKLAKFKGDHKRELIRFRNKVESFLINAASIDNLYLRSKSIEQFIIETNDDVKDLTERMKSAGWKKITFGRFLAYSTVGLSLTKAFISGEIIGAVAAAFGVGSQIYTTIRDSRKTDVLKGKYAAYAVLAKKKLK